MAKFKDVVAQYSGWFLFGIAILVSGALLAWSIAMPKPEFVHELLRDLGIGCLVAAIIGGFFELHMRSRFEIETIAGVLETAFGEVIRADVWEEIKKQIFSKCMVRENAVVRLDLIDAPGLPEGTLIVALEFGYEIAGLHAASEREVLVHRLDEHNTHKDIPKFTFVKVGQKILMRDGKIVASEGIEMTDGWLKIPIAVPTRSGKRVHVVTERKELAHVPGTYNLIMGQLTKQLQIHLGDVPDDVEVVASLRPHREPMPLRRGAPLDTELDDLLLLPGQLIEFRFKRVVQSDHAEKHDGRSATG